jgi:hypothetical protein
MTSDFWYLATASLIGAVVLPWFVMRLLLKALRSTKKAQATNYAGKTVVYGLGIVWLVWSVILIFAQNGVQFYLNLTQTDTTVASVYLFGSKVLYTAMSTALACFGFGLIDDVYGERGSGGFRGHLKALFSGTLTTGGLKLIGITIISLISGYTLSVAPSYTSLYNDWYCIPLAILTGAAIALSANFVNLTDLRPARASKMYIVLILVGFVTGVLHEAFAGGLYSANFGWLEYLLGQAILLIWLLGPILVTWKYDAGETAMLGDAGANPMGALAGLYFAFNTGLIGLGLYVILMLALNLLSEKFSFTTIIANNPLLSKLDAAGRPKRNNSVSAND